MHKQIQICGIVNITADSFSDGGKYLTPAAAIDRATKLIADGADIIDLGPAASNPDAQPVSPETEIQRLDPVLTALQKQNATISIDSYQLATQRYALSKNVEFLNDIQGFPQSEIYPDLAAAKCKLIVMHSVQQRGKATRVDISPAQAWDHITEFFHRRIAELTKAGISRDRLILDPGMGFFLSTNPAASLNVLANLARLKSEFALPLHISVSRKSFLRAMTANDPALLQSATLAAEIVAAQNGADYIRTHEAAPLRAALRVLEEIKKS